MIVLRDLMCEHCEGWGQHNLAGGNGVVDCVSCQRTGAKPDYIDLVKTLSDAFDQMHQHQPQPDEAQLTTERPEEPKEPPPALPQVPTFLQPKTHLPMTAFRLRQLALAARSEGKEDLADVFDATNDQWDSDKRELRELRSTLHQAEKKIFQSWLNGQT